MFSQGQSLRELYNLDSSVEELVKRYGLEKEGDKLIEQLCKEKLIDVPFFMELIKIFHNTDYFPQKQLLSFDITIVLDYLQRTHRYYIGRRLPEIEQMVQNIVSNDENEFASFLLPFFRTLKTNLTEHIKEEEKQLFPYIIALNQRLDSLTTKFKNTFIASFADSHNHLIEDQLVLARSVLIENEKKTLDTMPLRVLIYQLDLLEKDLRLHAKIEDHVLMPKARLLEKELNIS